MEDAVVSTEERGNGKSAGKCAAETGVVCKKSLVMPPNTMILDVEDVLYYNENKGAYDSKKRSPYLIYLSSEFRTAMKRRSRKRVTRRTFVKKRFPWYFRPLIVAGWNVCALFLLAEHKNVIDERDS
ncbi:UNVERIFIED_CONTAM: hypothetical protein PYX00_011765 [Menopon gallinae]|uniref:Uncharacterized protein n=1 Tax=Menopon gallinae TaxID=328185 RepID=A0AAW2H8E5_9NEOP